LMGTNTSCIHEEMKGMWNLGSAWCHAVQNLLSSSLLSVNVKIKIIYKIIVLHTVLHRCRTWTVIVRKESGLWVFQNRVLWRTFGTKGGWSERRLEKINERGASANIIRMFKSRRMDGGACSSHREEMNCGTFWSENLKVTDHSEDLRLDVRIILKINIKEIVWSVWIEFI
jgi:hypothetical protein